MSPTSSPAASSSSSPNNKTLVVILSSVLSVVAVLVLAGLVFVCCRCRQRGKGFFPRGISPIDDDEIETWKGHNPPGMDDKEKSVFSKEADPNSPPLLSVGTFGAGATVLRQEQEQDQHQHQHRAAPAPVQPPHKPRARGVSLDSAATQPAAAQPRPGPPRRTPSNVIVYKDPPASASSSTPALRRPYSSGTGASPIAATPAGVAAIHSLQQQQQQHCMPTYRRSEEIAPRSARSLSFGHSSGRGMVGRFSSDQDRDYLFSSSLPALSPLAPTALQHACAPNSRAGLTDEAVPGDPSFLPTPKRQPSRLSKMPPAAGSPGSATPSTAPPVAAHAARRKSNSLSGSGSHPSLVSSPSTNSNSNSAAYWHARTRSTRSASTVSGRSYAGSDAALNQSFGMSHQRRPSQAQLGYFGRAQPPAAHASLHKNLPAPPPPVSIRAGHGHGHSHGRQASHASADYNLASRCSNSSIYRDYMSLEQQPRTVTMSPISSSASTSGGAGGVTDDSDGPLLAVRHISLEQAQSIGRAIG